MIVTEGRKKRRGGEQDQESLGNKMKVKRDNKQREGPSERQVGGSQRKKSEEGYSQNGDVRRSIS